MRTTVPHCWLIDHSGDMRLSCLSAQSSPANGATSRGGACVASAAGGPTSPSTMKNSFDVDDSRLVHRYLKSGYHNYRPHIHGAYSSARIRRWYD
jgi:hypothetical protein